MVRGNHGGGRARWSARPTAYASPAVEQPPAGDTAHRIEPSAARVSGVRDPALRRVCMCSRRSRGDRSNGECARSHALRAACVRNKLQNAGVRVCQTTTGRPACHAQRIRLLSHGGQGGSFGRHGPIAISAIGNATGEFVNCENFHVIRTHIIGAQPHPLHRTPVKQHVARFGARLRLQEHGRHAGRGRTPRTLRHQARCATPHSSTVSTSCTSLLKDSLSCPRTRSVRPASRPLS